MVTFSNTFTYFANTGDLNFDVSVEELGAQRISKQHL